jgi:ABC-type phosphate transport system substrate-binding protein
MKYTAIFMTLFFSHNLFADVIVVAHPDVTLTKEDAADVFKGDKVSSGSIKLVLVDNKSAQADFLKKVLSMDQIKYSSSWAKKSFQDGLTAPKMKGSDADVIEFVKSTPGAVGYVSASAAGVKEVGKF